jgi:folylpolyglutamate synthase/dihydropteroate synthase
VKKMKKAVALLAALAILASFAVAAVAVGSPAPVLPGNGLYTAISALELSQYEISEDLLERALLQNTFANRRLEALEQAAANSEGFGAAVIEQLILFLNGHEENLGLIIAAMAREKDAAGGAAVLSEILEQLDERGWRLAEIADPESGLPDGARAGAAKALANMEAAAVKAALALGDEDRSAPPPWSGGRIPPGPPVVPPVDR